MNLITDLNKLRDKLMNQMILEYSCGEFEEANRINHLITELDMIINKLEKISKLIGGYM